MMAPALPSILWWSSDMCDRRQHDDEFAPGLILEVGTMYFIATDEGWQVINDLPDDAQQLIVQPPLADEQCAEVSDRLFLRQIAGTVDVRTRGEHWQREVLHRVGVLARGDVRQPATEPHRTNAADELRVAAGNLYDFLDSEGVGDLLNPASAAALRRRADAVQDAIRATTSVPSSLPTTLASVDDADGRLLYAMLHNGREWGESGASSDRETLRFYSHVAGEFLARRAARSTS